jgi:hypothetical protein
MKASSMDEVCRILGLGAKNDREIILFAHFPPASGEHFSVFILYSCNLKSWEIANQSVRVVFTMFIPLTQTNIYICSLNAIEC